MPGEVFLGRQGAHFGSEYELSCGRIGSHFAFGTLGELNCGQIGAHLSCVHSTKAFRVVTQAGNMRAAPGKKSVGLRAQEEKVERVEEAKRVAVESEVILRLGLAGSSMAVEWELT